MYTARATALLILDAQKRTKAVPGNLDSELTYVAGWCYWYKGATAVKEFAYSCLELLTKDKLNLILKELGLNVAKSAAKAEMVKVLKGVKITDLRAVLTQKVMPDCELSVVTFEKLFHISTANRRRLQEMNGVLPITSWGQSKYGNYPIFSLVKILEILHADKNLLQPFYDYVEKNLTEKARALAQQRERERANELSFQEKYFALADKYPEFVTKISEIKGLLKAEKFRTAYNLLHTTVLEQERFERIQNNYLELCNQLGEEAKVLNDINSLNQAIHRLEKNLQILQTKTQMKDFAKALDNLLQQEVEVFTQSSNHQFKFTKELQSNQKALKFCQLILSQHGKCTESQMRWKQVNNVTETIADLEDLIFSHPILLQVQGVTELS